MTKSASIILCPGIHDPKLTESFLAQLREQFDENGGRFCQSENILIFPAPEMPAYSGFHIWQFLKDNLARGTGQVERGASPLVFISFSAGVAGAIAAATWWQRFTGGVRAFIALDGWGVPLYGDFPIYRLSHDYFTHWSSAVLGAGEESFWAEPEVEHLDLWRAPKTARGWRIRRNHVDWEPPTPTTAALFLATLIERHAAYSDFHSGEAQRNYIKCPIMLRYRGRCNLNPY